jgi:16S rRNA (guanine966-N2)-methyltransferase
LRIIGGQWRSRKLEFHSAEGLRPSGDRIRETLFNWLAPYIEGARCLDLFAGSGALGLEALSRGAAACDFVELNTQSARQIEQHLKTLQATNGKVHNADALQFLTTAHPPYDIVFLDPPFHQGLIDKVINPLLDHIAQEGLIYIELAKGEAFQAPASIAMKKSKLASQVEFQLYQVSDSL